MTADQPLFKTQHTGFTVSNLERSIAFYRDMFGFELFAQRRIGGKQCATLTGVEGAEIDLAFLQMPGHVIELLQYVGGAGLKKPTRTCDVGNGHLCFEVESMAAAHAHLVAKGVRFVSDPLPITGGPNNGGFVVYFEDPDGIRLELIQRGANAPHFGLAKSSRAA
jgi:catechol 2,3-dioxygenase-like lactoylglutathione lyase family enzyme